MVVQARNPNIPLIWIFLICTCLNMIWEKGNWKNYFWELRYRESFGQRARCYVALILIEALVYGANTRGSVYPRIDYWLIKIWRGVVSAIGFSLVLIFDFVSIAACHYVFIYKCGMILLWRRYSWGFCDILTGAGTERYKGVDNLSTSSFHSKEWPCSTLRIISGRYYTIAVNGTSLSESIFVKISLASEYRLCASSALASCKQLPITGASSIQLKPVS